MTAQTQQPTVSEAIPSGFTEMTPLEMNSVFFSSKKTVLTPEIIQSLVGK